VEPSDVGVLKSAQGDKLLTLITCYPFNYIGSAPHRFVVRARAVDVSAGTERHPLPTKS
jgi:sortase A